MIFHVDGDAFFASVVQATYPHLKGKPIATGRERSVAIAVSYEAKRLGVKRCMPTWEIKKICPSCIIVDSEFKLYHLFSQRMFEIVRSFTPIVEEYSIDEAFADITQLPALYKTDYKGVGKIIKDKIEQSLGITVSVGISLTKSLAKIASNYEKPNGLTFIREHDIKSVLRTLPVESIWGVGFSVSRRMHELQIHTALDFISLPENKVKAQFDKPQLEIWRELQGNMMYKIDPKEKNEYKSMSKVETFYPPTSDQNVLWARLIDRLEDAFQKARKYGYNVGRVMLFLKTQKFGFHSIEIVLPEKTNFPYLIKATLKEGFKKIYRQGVLYRATGCHLSDFEPETTYQSSLFNSTQLLQQKLKKIYPLYEKKQIQFGTALLDKTPPRSKDLTRRLSIPVLQMD